jgi:hypothetical protein
MKNLLIIICLFSSIIVNSQDINWNKFDEKKLNREIFDLYDESNDYIFVNFPDVKKVDQLLWWNFNKIAIGKQKRLSTDELISKINQDILSNSVAIIDCIHLDKIKCVPCDQYKSYWEIAERCKKDWDNPSDMFGINGFITVTSYFNKKTNTLYVVGFVKSYVLN